MELDSGEALPTLMERLSRLLSLWTQPFPRAEVERLVASPIRAQVAIDALIAGGYVLEDSFGRLRVQRLFVRRAA